MSYNSILDVIELNSSNLTNDSLPSFIELEFDTSSIFNPKLSFNQPSFWIGAGVITIMSFMISYILSYHYYPYIDRKQKLIKLKASNIYPYPKKEIDPHLNTLTNSIQDINDTVFDFANIQSKSVNSILDSTIEKQPLHGHLIRYLLISTLLIASYFQFYWVISHWNDSYKSYIETQCYPFIGYINEYYERATINTQKYYHYLQVNMNKICDENDDQIFYVETNIDPDDFDIDQIDNSSDAYHYKNWQYSFDAEDIMNIDTSNSVSCYVNKDTFTVRAPVKSDDCCNCVRCGDAGYCGDFGCACCNGCLYCLCCMTGLTSLCTFLYLCCAKLCWNTSDKYNKIQFVKLNEIEMNRKNEQDVLLRIKENESDFY